MSSSAEIRSRLVDTFRRDLIGPHPDMDADLARELLNENPSRWYLAGFIAPAKDPHGLDGPDDDEDPSVQNESEIGVEEPDTDGAGGAAGDAEEPEAPNTRRRFLPSSIGLTVLLDPDIRTIEARISWGDYRTEPPLPENQLLPEPPAKEAGEDGKPQRKERAPVDWVRVPKERTVVLSIGEGRGKEVLVPDSAAEQRAELRVARPGGEVRIGLLAGEVLDPPLDSHLATERRPVEQERASLRVLRLAAVEGHQRGRRHRRRVGLRWRVSTVRHRSRGCRDSRSPRSASRPGAGIRRSEGPPSELRQCVACLRRVPRKGDHSVFSGGVARYIPSVAAAVRGIP